MREGRVREEQVRDGQVRDEQVRDEQVRDEQVREVRWAESLAAAWVAPGRGAPLARSRDSRGACSSRRARVGLPGDRTRAAATADLITLAKPTTTKDFPGATFFPRRRAWRTSGAMSRPLSPSPAAAGRVSGASRLAANAGHRVGVPRASSDRWQRLVAHRLPRRRRRDCRVARLPKDDEGNAERHD